MALLPSWLTALFVGFLTFTTFLSVLHIIDIIASKLNLSREHVAANLSFFSALLNVALNGAL